MPSQAKALLIGNWQYEHPEGGMPPLRGPRHDVEMLKSALTHPTYGLFKEEDVVVRRNLTGNDLSDALSEVIAASQPDDVLLIYYSGHGERLGDDQLLGLVGVDVPFERRANRSLDTRQLSDWLRVARARSKILVLDCCYSGQFRGGDEAETEVLSTFGTGTVVLSSGGNQPVPDQRDAGPGEVLAEGPSPFTEALAAILVDETLSGTNGVLTAEDVYAALDRYEPRLKPRPRRNLAAEGRIGLAKRKWVPSEGADPGLRGWPERLRMIPVDVRFTGGQVEATWDRDGNGQVTNDERDVTALDPTRLAAIRRLCELADAVMRARDYSEPKWQNRARRALETAGANLFDVALPPAIQQLLRDAEDDDQLVVQLRLTFDRPWEALSEYPWEFLHVPSPHGVDPTGAAQRRVVVTRTGRPNDRPGRDSSELADVAVVSSVARPFARLAIRVGQELVAMPTVRTLATPGDQAASWAQLMEAIDQKPEYLVLCTPLLRSSQDGLHAAKLGFAGGTETDWRTAKDLAGALRTAGGLKAVVVASVAAASGLDAIRAAPLAAAELNSELGVPVVFICHTPGLESYVDEDEPEVPKTFAGVLLAALTRGHDVAESVWYARERVLLRYVRRDLQPTFGVPGFYYGTPTERTRQVRTEERQPGQLGNRSRPAKSAAS